ncbi:MAG TPA: acyl transferase, partial [Aequorivita sp.]|nr:acyl transferase [Aequorivita sp.]
EDALSYIYGKTGGINVIDLANIYSCAFIATQDLGKTFPDGSFEIVGRFDSSDIRGCNLMVF